MTAPKAPKSKPQPDLADSILARDDGSDAPLLELSTLAPKRPTIRIKTAEHPDGKLYELRIMNDFGVELQQQLTADGAEFDRLWKTEGLDQDGQQRLKLLLDRMYAHVLDAPDDVKEALVDGQRSQVVLAFTLAPLAAAAAAAQANMDQQKTAGNGSTTAS